MVFGIETIVAQHLEMLFRDVYNEAFDKIKSGDTFGDGLMVFVSRIVEGHIFSIVFFNTRGCNDGPAQISGDIFDGNIGSTKIGFCSDIETLGVIFVDIIFDFAEGRSDSMRHLFQEDLAEGIA